MIFKEPPIDVNFTLLNPNIVPEGLMKQYLGTQYDSKQIAANHNGTEHKTCGCYIRSHG